MSIDEPAAAIEIKVAGSRLKASTASGLSYTASTRDDDGVLDEFYHAYDTAFVLPNEKEGYDGFVECLKLNEGEKHGILSRWLGPFREFVATVRGDDGSLVGGLNFIVTKMPADHHLPAALTVHLNYVFVLPAYRGQGMFRTMVQDFPQITRALFAVTNPEPMLDTWSPASAATYVFLELNDPYRMSVEDYERDTSATGLDQVARIGIWCRRGAKIVDFEYAQPPLTPSQAPDPNLALAVLGCPTSTLQSRILKHHLLRFFAVSVLKGGDPTANPTAFSQLNKLDTDSATVRLFTVEDIRVLPRPTSSGGHARDATLRGVLSSLVESRPDR